MKKWRKRIAPVLLITLLIAVWELVVRIKDIPLYVLPAPSQVVGSLVTDWSVLAGHAGVTVMEALAGMAIALVLAVTLGIAMDAFPAVKSGLYPVLVVTQTVPMIVLAPILIIYLGFGLTPKILTVVLMCFFPVVVSFTDAMGQMDEEYVHLVRSFGAGRWEAYRLVKIPAAVPGLVSGLKVAATYSISGAVVGEWIGAQSGLGYYLLRVKNSYMLDKVFACVLVIVALSLCMNGAIRLYQMFAMPYGEKKE
ncbi:MAG TPA: ABC transporter permease [Candidatus Lachnoclostridium stercorigallinarum]|uniref:ABC transporter permease n=1 Tax=Candidatus Lachnoclostridium stercorigallinarum TaxID=2838634 RepID=A0A9D2GH65_9FIRM|nr:ABC transporter permease [Candidatus Lachnoclostridium stercorigallinarum]